MPYEHFSIKNLHVRKKDTTLHLLGFKIFTLVAMKYYSLFVLALGIDFNALNSSTAQIQNSVKQGNPNSEAKYKRNINDNKTW